MRLRSEADLEAGLFSRWRELREAGRFDRLLPRCVTQTFGAFPDGESRGYVTLDYRVLRQFDLPGVWGEGRPGRADLVELYWSVRTRGGVQDVTWAPSLNAHVIELKNEPLAVKHVEQLFRYVVALRGALQMGGIADLIRERDVVNPNVRGLLLGPEVSAPTAIIDALAAFAEVPISIGRFVVDPIDGVKLDTSGREQDVFQVGIFDTEALKAIGKKLIAQDSMFVNGGIWTLPEGHRGGAA